MDLSDVKKKREKRKKVEMESMEENCDDKP